ncbi:MAG TPA: hypothetical protein VFO07_13875 [Roseiflexaceae bacterium]|nr:hypothetical protein [Roseiflexaceae bacterium]
MAETGIKANEIEASRLFQRGVAAARGGQRRVAAVLLGRAVQLNPRHELGWLWLSGVLDDPNEIAFCLRSVLSVNPHNQRARQGLEWLEQRALVPTQPAPSLVAEQAPVEEEHEETRQARHEGEAWWVNWRRARRDMSRVRLVFWSMPILLLLLTLALRMTLRQAVERNELLIQEALQAPPVEAAVAAPPPVAILQAELPAARDAQALAYLSALNRPRAHLREAVQTYKDATSQPGGSSVAHAAAARKLREAIDTAGEAVEALTPPAALAQAHSDYLAGLELERAALGDVLEFYNSFSISLANRAALRLEDADKRIQRARTRFDAYRVVADSRAIAPQTIR